jgi:hypothetical protein
MAERAENHNLDADGAFRIDITGIPKWRVVQALHKFSLGGRGMGILHEINRDLTEAEAQEILRLGDDASRMFPEVRVGQPKLYLDYICGRPIKTDISGDTIDGAAFDRENGSEAASYAINWARAMEGVEG